MKKILICSHWMEIGGAERALLGLLYNLDYSEYSVDLYLCRHSGEFMELIPGKVNLLPEDKNAAAIAIPGQEAFRKKRWAILLGRLYAKLKTRLYLQTHHVTGNNNIAIEYSNKYTYKFINQINPNTEYDLAISFLEPHYITAYKTRAKKKIAWIHTDYQALHVDVEEGYKIWGEFNGIAAISQDCLDNFVNKFPKLKNKVFLIENPLPETVIRKQATENIPEEFREDFSEFKILSIGRFCFAKNFENIPDICFRLISMGLDVHWYIIGYGNSDLINEKIKELAMDRKVTILGKKENPYPYIQNCDLYVQPSRYEGKCVTVREAQMLGKPVVITNYSTSNSQLTNGVDGIIVPMENEECARGIAELLNNPGRMKQLSKNCAQKSYTNAESIQKIYSYLND